MDLTVRTEGGVPVVRVKAVALDASTALAFKRDMEPILAGHETVIVDLSDVDLMDSSGLGALITCFSRLKSNSGRLCLAGPGDSVRYSLELARADRLLDLFNTAEDALAACREPDGD